MSEQKKEDVQKKIFQNNLLYYLGDRPQAEVAKAIGVSPQTFNTWCQGIAMPRMEKMQIIADYFEINKSDLIEDKDNYKREFIEIYDKASPIHKAKIEILIEIFTNNENTNKNLHSDKLEYLINEFYKISDAIDELYKIAGMNKPLAECLKELNEQKRKEKEV